MHGPRLWGVSPVLEDIVLGLQQYWLWLLQHLQLPCLVPVASLPVEMALQLLGLDQLIQLELEELGPQLGHLGQPPCQPQVLLQLQQGEPEQCQYL